MLAGALVLVVALLRLLPAAARPQSAPVVTGLSTASVAVEGVTPVTVTGSGFGAAGATGLRHPPVCRITSRGCGAYCSGNFAYSGAPGNVGNASKPPANPNNQFPKPSTVIFAATVVSDTQLRCTPPAVIVNGLGTLEVGIGTHSSIQPLLWSGGTPVEYTLLFDVALGRRPYITETSGHLLLQVNNSLVGTVVTVEATLPALPVATWHWKNVSLNSSNILELALGTELPATVNTDMMITITLADGTEVNKWRRFMRAPPPPPGVIPTQVDHFRKGLLVGGEPFVGAGWYISVGMMRDTVAGSYEKSDIWPLLDRQAIVGDNQLMPYFFGALSHPHRLELLDYCQKLGLKVMIPLGVNVAYSADPVKHEWLVSNVTTYMNHTAVLGWYICDDCCKGEAVTSAQAVLYNAIKAVDPWHIVIGALQCDQLFWQWSDYRSFLEPSKPPTQVGAVIPAGAQPRLQLALDVIMWEDYREFDFPALATAFVPGEIRRGMAFEPIINCCESGWV
jgi:hypothetical protein